LLLFQAKNNGSQILQQESSNSPPLANNKPASTNNKLTGSGWQDDLSDDNFKPSRYDLFHYATVPTRQWE
jgi:hypothetical protein